MLPRMPVTATAAGVFNRGIRLPAGNWPGPFTGAAFARPASRRAFTWGCRWCSNRENRDGEAGVAFTWATVAPGGSGGWLAVTGADVPTAGGSPTRGARPRG